MTRPSVHFQLFIGCLTRETPYFPNAHGKGIAIADFDGDTGALAVRATFGEIVNPVCFAVDERHDRLYVCSEVFEWDQGRFTACAIGADGLTVLNHQDSGGSISGFATLDRSGGSLLAINYSLDAPGRPYGAGVVMLPIAADGRLEPIAAALSHRHFPLGPNAARQERSHAHVVVPSPDNRFLLVADLGIDRVLAYRFDAVARKIAAEPAATLETNPGAGPRHLVFHPNGRWLYLIDELDSTVCLIAFDAATGGLELLQVLSCVPDGFTGANDACALEITADGRFLYATNRGHDSVAMFAVSADDGRLEARGHVPCGGRTPRALAIDPSGTFVLVANQNSDTVAVFRIDRESGALAMAGEPQPIGTPMAFAFRRSAGS